MLGIGLGLGTAIFWGLADFFGGLTTRRAPLSVVTSASQAIGLAGLGLALLIVSPPAPEQRDVLIAGVGGALSAIAVSAIYSAFAAGKMSTVAALPSIGICIPVIVGLVGGDDPKLIQVAGILVAALGVIFVSRAGSGAQTVQRTSIALALVAALCFGCYLVAMDEVADAGTLWMLFVSRVVTVALLAGVLIAARPKRPTVADVAPGIAAIGLFDLAGTAAFLLAADNGLLSVVSVLASLYGVATIVVARFVLGERLNTPQRIGVGCALTGVAMIAVGA